MPELKRVFQAGKMNRDLDDRLLPNGEYREALNVNVGRSESSDIGALENLLGNEAVSDFGTVGSVTIGVYRDNTGDRIYFFNTTNNSTDFSNSGEHFVYEFEQRTGNTNLLATGTWLNFHQEALITGINYIDSLLYWTDDRSQPRKINVDRGRSDSAYYSSDLLAAVAKFAPFEAPTVTGITTSADDDEVNSNFLQDKLPRFAYRLQYNDGEYSTISPFTPICFAQTDNILATDSAIRTGELAGLVNDIKTVGLSVPLPTDFIGGASQFVDIGVTNIELLYKETTNNNVYIIDEVVPEPGLDTISFIYRSQDPFRTLPNDQVTRVYDAVPRLAKSQEIAGSRIVYGNYLQNRNIPNISFRVEVTNTGSDLGHSIFTNYSVKSRRTYQVGIILSDQYGRQSPVILSSTGNDSVFLDALDQVGLPEARQKLNLVFETLPPSWAHSYRIVVKQREQEYYNIIANAVVYSNTTIGSREEIQDFPTTFNAVGRFGDTINKLPIDRTIQSDEGGAIAPTSTSLYPKFGGINPHLSGLIKTEGIINQTGQAIIPGLPASGLVVYETEPIISEIDIFFETSTGKLAGGINLDEAIPIDFYNCFIQDLFNSAGTGVIARLEINRIRAGFNEPFFDVGVRAYQVQENFAEERRSNALIHSSGFFNSRTSLNELNQFNEAVGGITVSLDPADGSIQKLFAEDTQILIFQEDKISRSPIDKDFIYSAEGGAVPVTSNTQYLGTIAPYPGEYGISRDPASFAVYGTDKYFTDRSRGVVLKLSQQGLQEISRSGMVDFFRDALFLSNKVVGSYDEYANSYNLTLNGQGYTTMTDTNVGTARDNYLTVAWEENVGGWVTFKSFDQEAGETMNNRFYTFKGGDIYLHNSTSVARNSFYGRVAATSYVDLIFNDAPSVIKDFKTLSLEGTPGWVCEFIETDLETLGEAVEVEDSVTITFTNSNSLANTILAGTRTQIGIPSTNAALTWTIIARPTDASRIFTQNNQAGIVNPNLSGLTITGETPTIDNGDTLVPGTLVNGTLVWQVVYSIEDLDAGTLDTINFEMRGSGPASITTGHLVILNVRGNIPNTSITPLTQTLADTDFSQGVSINQVSLTAQPITNTEDITQESYYFSFDPNNNLLPIDTSGSNSELTWDFTNLETLIPTGTGETTYLLGGLSSDNLITRFSLLRPASEVLPVITASGSGPATYPRVQWNLLDFFQENVAVREAFSYPGATPLVLPDHRLGAEGSDQSTVTYISPRERATNNIVFEPISTHTFVRDGGTTIFTLIPNPAITGIFDTNNITEELLEDGTWEVTLTPGQVVQDTTISYNISGAAVPVNFTAGASVLLTSSAPTSGAVSYISNVLSDAFISDFAIGTLTDTKPNFVLLDGPSGPDGQVEVLRSTEGTPIVSIGFTISTPNFAMNAGGDSISRSFHVRAVRADFSAPVEDFTATGNVLAIQVTQPAISHSVSYASGGTVTIPANVNLSNIDAADVEIRVTDWTVVGSGSVIGSVGGLTNGQVLVFNRAGGTSTFTVDSTIEWSASISYPGDTAVTNQAGNSFNNAFILPGYTGNHIRVNGGSSVTSTSENSLTTFDLQVASNPSALNTGTEKGGGLNESFVNMALLTISPINEINVGNKRVGDILIYINQRLL